MKSKSVRLQLVHDLSFRLIKILVSSVLLALLIISQSAGDDISTAVTTGKIAEGTKYETPYFILESSVNGPVVVVIAGMHGDSPAGVEAAEKLKTWNIQSGKLIVIPRANKISIAIQSRLMPVDENRNLNRNFPVKNEERAKCELSQAIWDFVKLQKPNWLVELDEGTGYRSSSDDAFGNSIRYYPDIETLKTSRRMADSINTAVIPGSKEFVMVRYPLEGSLVWCAGEKLGAKSMVVSTTGRSESLKSRTDQHLIMLDRLFKDIGLLADDSSVESNPAPVVDKNLFSKSSIKTGEIRVAIYDGSGAQEDNGLRQKLSQLNDLRIENLNPEQIINGDLDSFDVLIVPGGFVSEQARAITPAGLDQIRKFVRNGGGYIGFCAGAYLAANNFHWSLKIIDADVIDIQNWERGTGAVKIELTDAGKIMLGNIPGQFNIAYGNGPILKFADNPEIPDFIPLAIYKSELNENDAPTGVMIDTPAIVIGQFGMGRVFVSSPHPESTGGLDNLVQQALLWTAGRQMVIN
jgi:glutamine amidotransferase-like uncharacterized protein